MKKNNLYLYFISVITAIGGLMFGFDIAIISGAIPFIQSYFDWNDLQLGWSVSYLLIGAMIGALGAGSLTDRYGRKKILIIVALFFAITCFITAIVTTSVVFVTARLFGGLAVGAASVLSPMYIAEISPPGKRGMLVSLYQLTITTGILISYLVNFGLHDVENNWRWMFASGIAPSVLFLSDCFRKSNHITNHKEISRQNKKFENMKKIFVLLILTGLISCASGEKDPISYYHELDLNTAPNTLGKKEQKNGWQLLFDGTNIDGWRGYNMEGFPDCWKIEKGAFTMTTEGKGESQDLITDKIYENFVFSTEVKFSRGSNSGLIYQVKEDPKYNFPYETGPEFQIIDHENWHTPLEDWQIMGANYAMYPPKVQSFKDIGEWNHLLLVVHGNKVTQFLNGEIVVEYEKYSDDWMLRRNSGKWERFPDWGKFDKGHIALQNHGSDVWFRSIKIKVLN